MEEKVSAGDEFALPERFVIKPRMTRTRKHKLLRQFREPFLFSGAVIAVLAILRLFIVNVMYVPSASMDPTIPVGSRLFFLKGFGQTIDTSLSNPWGLAIPIILIVVVVMETFVILRQRGTHSKKTNRILGTFLVCLVLLTMVIVPHHTAYDQERATIGSIIVFHDDNGWLSGSNEYVVKRIIAVGGQTVKGDGKGIYVDGKKLDESYLPEGTEPTLIDFDTKVPDGKVFVMGDNRGLSEDSRAYLSQGDKAFVSRSSIVGIPFMSLDVPFL